MVQQALTAIVMLALCGCTTTTYKEPAPDERHAVLRFEDRPPHYRVLVASDVTPTLINGLSPSDWRWSLNNYRIRPGRMVIDVTVHFSPVMTAYGSIEFVAISAESYRIGRVLNNKTVTVFVNDSNEKTIAEVTLTKQPIHESDTTRSLLPNDESNK